MKICSRVQSIHFFVSFGGVDIKRVMFLSMFRNEILYIHLFLNEKITDYKIKIA